MRKIRVVQIGLGHDHAALVLESMMRQKEIFDVAGIALPESEQTDFADRAAKFKNIPYLSVEEALALPNLDGAVIETEEVNLTRYALMAAERGLNIHMDKPGGTELSDFEELIRAVSSKNLVFSTGYMYRFNPKIKEALSKIENGDIGEVYCVEAHMDCEHTPKKRQWLGRFPGGMMFFLGCHLIDLIYRIQGEPEKVIPMNVSTGYDGVTAQDYGMVLLQYRGGISFAKTCANECGGFSRRQLVICGTKGTIEIKPLEAFDNTDPMRNQYTEMREIGEGEKWGVFGKHTRSECYNRYDEMMKNFARLVSKETENPYTYDYELNLYRLLLRACGKELS